MNNQYRKPRLHKSQLNMFLRCGMQYKFRYVKGIKKQPAAAMILGTSVHKSSERDMVSKRDYGELLSLEHVKDVAADTVNIEWDKTGVALDDDEKLLGESVVRGSTVDQAVKLAELHHKKLAPTLSPKYIERPFTVKLNGFPVDISGTIDIQETNGVLRDLKTSKSTPPEGKADGSIELSFYGLASKALDGKYPDKLILDFLVKNKIPKLVSQESKRNELSYKALLIRIELISKAIESGLFVPCDPDDWVCSEKWCGYYGICEFGRKARVSVGI